MARLDEPTFPEMACEFAAHVKDRFILRGPEEQKEGGSTTENSSVGDSVAENTNGAELPNMDQSSAMDNSQSLLTQSRLGIDLLSELQGKYELDPFFWSILKKPTDFWNFKVKNHLLYFKSNNK